MKAVNNYIIVENKKEGPKKVGGLLLTEETDLDNRYIKAKVMSVGNFVEGIKKGDDVRYDRHAGHLVEHDKTMYYVIKSGDVVLID